MDEGFEQYFVGSAGSQTGSGTSQYLVAAIGATGLEMAYKQRMRTRMFSIRSESSVGGLENYVHPRQYQSWQAANPGVMGPATPGEVLGSRFDASGNYRARSAAARASTARRANVRQVAAWGRQNDSVFRRIRSSFLKTKAFFIADLALLGADLAMSVARPGVQKIQDREQKWLKNEMYADSVQAYTMRQRAMQAVSDSQMSLRPVLGNEASYLHS